MAAQQKRKHNRGTQTVVMDPHLTELEQHLLMYLDIVSDKYSYCFYLLFSFPSWQTPSVTCSGR